MTQIDFIADVAAFHRVTNNPDLTTPAFPSDERCQLRIDLCEEEVGESCEAIALRDMIEVADGIVDSIYVLVGTALELGLPLAALWQEVHRTNMAKAARQEDGSLQVLKRADGKILKPKGWIPPDIAGVLRAHGWEG